MGFHLIVIVSAKCVFFSLVALITLNNCEDIFVVTRKNQFGKIMVKPHFLQIYFTNNTDR